MHYLRFELEGLINSFRIPVIKTFHKTYLAPSRTHILGLIANISGLSEKGYYDLLLKDIKVSIVIDNLEGGVKDLWVYKSLSTRNHGRSPLRRSKNYKSSYSIYLQSSEEQIMRTMYKNLMAPQRISSLGMDDELVIIKNVKQLNEDQDIVLKRSSEVHSVFPYSSENEQSYNVMIIDVHAMTMYPQDNLVIRDFKFKEFSDTKRGTRFPDSTIYVKEFYNCTIQLKDQIDTYYDSEKNKYILFY